MRISRVWKQGNLSGPLDGLGELPLMFGAVAVNTHGNDLAAFSEEISQSLDFLVVDLQFFIHTETTHFAPYECFFSFCCVALVAFMSNWHFYIP